MATFASVVVQDLTFTETQLGLGVTISYTNTGTAGSESVSVSDKAITIAIESGVSTATQIRTAFNASPAAVALATCTVSGTGSNAQVSCKNATLAGGTAAVKATFQLPYGLFLQYKTAGVAGNSAQFKLEGGATAGAETVTVSSDDITVGIEDGVTTWNQIRTALNAETDFTDVFTIEKTDSYNVPFVARVSPFTDFAAFTGGLDAVAASVIVQDLTISGDVADASKNGKTVSYTTGATAGAEVVAVDGSGNVSVQIENGVSTATQIAAALNAAAAFTGAKATGTVTVVDYTKASAVAASGTVTVADYTLAGALAASGVVTVVDYSALAGAILTVNGTPLTEGIDWTAATDNDTTAASLELAIEAVTGISSSATNAVITVTAATAGTAGNAITLATDDAVNLTISGATLTGGRDATTVTINGTPLVANVDWTAETSNDVTAANLEVAIEAVANISSSATNAVITVSAAATGTAGNAYTLATSYASAVAVSGATLTGGRNATTVTVNGTALVANVDWTAETSNNVTADNLAAAIDALAAVVAPNPAAAIITVTAASPGTAGNSIGLVTSEVTAVTVGAATLLGGTDSFAVTVSGTGATAQKTVNSLATSGAAGDGPNAYYKVQSATALTNAFVAFHWMFPAAVLTLTNDETAGTDQVIVSFDGTNTHYVLAPGESLTLNDSNRYGLWLKYGGNACDYRLMVVGA